MMSFSFAAEWRSTSCSPTDGDILLGSAGDVETAPVTEDRLMWRQQEPGRIWHRAEHIKMGGPQTISLFGVPKKD